MDEYIRETGYVFRISKYVILMEKNTKIFSLYFFRIINCSGIMLSALYSDRSKILRTFDVICVDLNLMLKVNLTDRGKSRWTQGVRKKYIFLSSINTIKKVPISCFIKRRHQLFGKKIYVTSRENPQIFDRSTPHYAICSRIMLSGQSK